MTKVSSKTTTNGTAASSDSVCSVPLQYATTNGVCLTEFANILTSANCPLDQERNVLVVRNEEDTATQLINELISIGASVECRRKVIPFVCQHLFGLCGELGVFIQPTSSQCEEIRDVMCQLEWRNIKKFSMDFQDCTIFPATTSSCPAINEKHSTNEPLLKSMLIAVT